MFQTIAMSCVRSTSIAVLSYMFETIAMSCVHNTRTAVLSYMFQTIAMSCVRSNRIMKAVWHFSIKKKDPLNKKQSKKWENWCRILSSLGSKGLSKGLNCCYRSLMPVNEVNSMEDESLRGWWSFSWSRYTPRFVEPESTLSHIWQPATFPSPETDGSQSRPSHHVSVTPIFSHIHKNVRSNY
jgi:hypothetical protein